MIGPHVFFRGNPFSIRTQNSRLLGRTQSQMTRGSGVRLAADAAGALSSSLVSLCDVNLRGARLSVPSGLRVPLRIPRVVA